MKLTDEEIQILRDRVESLEFLVESMKKRIDFLNKRLAAIENSSGMFNGIEYLQQSEQKEFAPPVLKKEISQPVNTDFVAEFNSLASKDGFDLKKSRDEFVQKYKVRAFNCTNFEARMNKPVQPEFAESTSVPSGEYWAVNISGNLFAVFPNVKTYSDNYHLSRAMGNVFDSNFSLGSTYNKIFVEKPAIFECVGNIWRLKEKGRLNLG